MKNIRLITVVGITLILLGTTSCRSKKSVRDNRANNSQQRQNQQNRKGQRRTPAQMITNMDKNNDGKLSADEARGRLKDNFGSIDTNRDGFLTLAEIKNAPKPRRGERGGNQAPPMRR